MPVDDHEIHPMTQFDSVVAGCYNAPRLVACRQIGRRTIEGWQPLRECLGCQAIKDDCYISKARSDIDREMARFMKADQRVI